MRLTASARMAAMAAVLAVPLAAAATTVVSGPAVAASGPARVTGGAQAAAPAWTQTRELKETNGAADDHYGWSVAMSQDGTTAAIGAPHYSNGGPGAVFVYKKVSGKWAQTAQLTGGYGGFGQNVAVSANGSAIVVGSPSDLGVGGGVAFFSDSSGSWQLTGSFIETTPELLGSSVAISGSGTTAAAVVGDYPGSGTETGAVFVYTHSSSGWKQTATITSKRANGIGCTYYCQDVGLSETGSRLVVGNPFTSSDTGSVFVFTHASTGGWVKTAVLRASDGAGVGGNEFGDSAAISADGSTIVAGDSFPGPAYVFSDSSGSWKQAAELLSSSASSVAVSANGSAVLVGDEGANSFTGGAYLYNLSGGTWTLTATLTSPGTFSLGSGVALSGSGSTALVGDADQTVGTASQEGAAYLYAK